MNNPNSEPEEVKAGASEETAGETEEKPEPTGDQTDPKVSQKRQRTMFQLAAVAAIAGMIGAGAMGHSIGYSSATNAWLAAERGQAPAAAPAPPVAQAPPAWGTGQQETPRSGTQRNPLEPEAPAASASSAPIAIESPQQAAERAGLVQEEIGPSTPIPAPRFAGVGLNGEAVNLDSVIGEKPVMLVFWTHW